MRAWRKILIATVCVLVGIELLGRWLGLTDYPLYVASDTYEYILAPNQDRTVYRNKVVTDRLGLRRTEKSSAKFVLLLVGDSIINGGNRIDQSELGSEILAKRLSEFWGIEVDVVNVSAGSWGPDNAVAFLNHHGTFAADMMVGIYSSHDATDCMTFTPVVGNSIMFPERQAATALGVIVSKVIDRFSSGNIDRSRVKRCAFARGFHGLDSIARSMNIPFHLYLHAEVIELASGEFRDKGQSILSFAEANDIPVQTDLSQNNSETYYLDNIHLNSQGQQMLANALFELVTQSAELK